DVDEVRPVDGIAADAHGRALADAEPGELADGLVGERAALGEDADAAGLVDVAGHDADLALTGRDDAGAVRTDEAGRRLTVEDAADVEHVHHGDALGDAHRERDL